MYAHIFTNYTGQVVYILPYYSVKFRIKSMVDIKAFLNINCPHFDSYSTVPLIYDSAKFF